MMKMKDYKNPIYNMYVAPYGYHFERSGQDIGRIIWIRNTDGITIEKNNR